MQKRAISSLSVMLCMLGCVGQHSGDNAGSTGSLEICYRGEHVRASHVHGELIIEGDILVEAGDQWCDEAQATDGVLRQGVKRQGANYKWPNGIIPYQFESTFSSSSDQAAAIAAMNEWQAVVPGIHFVAHTTEADVLEFRKDTARCVAAVGHAGGLQTVRVTAGCINNHSLHHEIGHALGLYHQHTRKDRDAFVKVLWANILGCRSTATGPSDCGPDACVDNLSDCGCTQQSHDNEHCYHEHDFTTSSRRSDIGSYDYDSVMHYPTNGFSKSGPTLEVLLNDSSGNPFPIGQTTHLSAGDQFAVNAMYPVLHVQRTIFSGHNSQTVCKLEGREDDVAVEFDMSGSSSPIVTPTVDRSQLLGDYNVACSVQSTFWADNYDYPNSSVALNTELTSESYSASTNLRVLSVGLLPTFL